MIKNKLVKRLTTSYIGENEHLMKKYQNGELEVKIVPMGTLVEKMRCAGAGIPAFYTQTGHATQVEYGGIPIKFDSHGTTTLYSDRKERREFEGKPYILETALYGDFALVKGAIADEAGNVVFNSTAKNVNIDIA